MGNMFLAATGKSSTSSLLPILFIAAIFIVIYMVMIRPQRNRQRQASQMQNTVVPGQRIRTTAGIYGTVISVDDTDVEVEVAPGVTIRMLRRAVMDVLGDESPMGGEPPQSSSGFDESNGQSTSTFGESPADDWNSPDRTNP
jgi:preprotein translocase subunit YajC